MDLEDLITDLKVLALLKENGRLCIRDGSLSIEPQLENKENILLTWGSYASLALRRWWNQDNRRSAMLKVQSIVMKCYDSIQRLQDKERQDFAELCSDASKGLAHLQQTYKHDAAVSARLSVYIKNLNEICS